MGIDNKEGLDYNLYDDIDKDLRNLRAQLESSTLSQERINDMFSTLAKKIESSTSNTDDIYFYNAESSFDHIRKAWYKNWLSHEKIEKMIDDMKKNAEKDSITMHNWKKHTTTRLSKMYDWTYKVEQIRYGEGYTGEQTQEIIVKNNLSPVEVYKIMSMIEQRFSKMNKAKIKKWEQEKRREKESRGREIDDLLDNS